MLACAVSFCSIPITFRRKIYDNNNDEQLRDEGSDVDGLILTPTDHLSPPSTLSRLSDSDTTSECDIDGMTPGASISSMGSSNSPPLLEVTTTTTTTKHNSKCSQSYGNSNNT